MLSSMTTAYLTANQDDLFEAAAAAVCAMGLCGEKAESRMSELDGNSTFRNYLIDAVYNLTPEELEKGAKYELPLIRIRNRIKQCVIRKLSDGRCACTP